MKTTDSLILCDYTLLVDSNEQAPYGFQNIPARAEHNGRRPVVRVVRRKLKTADYSIEGLEDKVAVERKSLEDLFGTLGQRREQFGDEFERMSQMDYCGVVVEADWREICRPKDFQEAERHAIAILEAGILSRQPLSEQALETLTCLEVWFQRCWESEPEKPESWRSGLNARSVWGTIFAWSQRYPKVHWFAMGSRRHAELATFEILDRYWREHNA